MSTSPGPVNGTLFGKKVFADVIKLIILRWGDYPVLSGWTLNAIICILRRGRQREMSHTQREGSVPLEAEIVVMWPQAKECYSHQNLEETRNDSPLEPLEGVQL